jgi:hypothetical protein
MYQSNTKPAGKINLNRIVTIIPQNLDNPSGRDYQCDLSLHEDEKLFPPNTELEYFSHIQEGSIHFFFAHAVHPAQQETYTPEMERKLQSISSPAPLPLPFFNTLSPKKRKSTLTDESTAKKSKQEGTTDEHTNYVPH